LSTHSKRKTRKSQDSMDNVGQNVYMNVSKEHMGKVSFRVDLGKWRRFVELCKRLGSSSCFELRSYIDARLGGESVVTSRQPLVIHQTLYYLFQNKRPRRIANYSFPNDETVRVQYFGSLGKCAFCQGKPVVLGHIWNSETECRSCYLCASHHEYYKRYAKRYGWRPC